MSLNSESKFFKFASSVKKMVNVKKNTEEYAQSDFDTTSTGSNESEISVKISMTKPLTPDVRNTKPTKDSKVKLSKSLRKKFFRHFSNVENDEEVLDRFHCALLGDILLQGYLYITENYFAFYSNVFGYVTKILIPILTVENITKEKTARIVPNAIGITTSDQKHIFGSFMSRDNTLEYMRNIWEKAISDAPEIIQSELTEQDRESSEFAEAESDNDSSQNNVIQTEGLRKGSKASMKTATHLQKVSRRSLIMFSTTVLLILLYISATVMLYRISQIKTRYSLALEDVTTSGSNMLYSDLLQWQTKLHSKSEGEIYSFLDSNLDEIAKVKQSLETLSSLLVDKSKILAEEVSNNPHETATGIN